MSGSGSGSDWLSGVPLQMRQPFVDYAKPRALLEHQEGRRVLQLQGEYHTLQCRERATRDEIARLSSALVGRPGFVPLNSHSTQRRIALAYELENILRAKQRLENEVLTDAANAAHFNVTIDTLHYGPCGDVAPDIEVSIANMDKLLRSFERRMSELRAVADPVQALRAASVFQQEFYAEYNPYRARIAAVEQHAVPEVRARNAALLVRENALLEELLQFKYARIAPVLQRFDTEQAHLEDIFEAAGMVTEDDGTIQIYPSITDTETYNDVKQTINSQRELYNWYKDLPQSKLDAERVAGMAQALEADEEILQELPAAFARNGARGGYQDLVTERDRLLREVRPRLEVAYGAIRVDVESLQEAMAKYRKSAEENTEDNSSNKEAAKSIRDRLRAAVNGWKEDVAKYKSDLDVFLAKVNAVPYESSKVDLLRDVPSSSQTELERETKFVTRVENSLNNIKLQSQFTLTSTSAPHATTTPKRHSARLRNAHAAASAEASTDAMDTDDDF